MKTRVLWLCSMLAVVTLLGAVPAHAQSERPQINKEEVQKRIDEARARLNLTDDQVAAIRPLALQEAQKLRAMRARYGENPSRRDKYSMFQEAKSVADSFNAGMRKILNDDQMTIWRQMQDEWRAKLKAEYSRRKSGGS